jgi:hypothetical protein
MLAMMAAENWTAVGSIAGVVAAAAAVVALVANRPRQKWERAAGIGTYGFEPVRRLAAGPAELARIPGLELGARADRAGADVTKDSRAAGLLERVELEGQVLLAGGDAGVADTLTAAGCGVAVAPARGGRRVRVPRGLLAGGHGGDCAPTPGRIGSGRTQVLDGVSHAPAALGLIAPACGPCVRLFLSFRTRSVRAQCDTRDMSLNISQNRDMSREAAEGARCCDEPPHQVEPAGSRPRGRPLDAPST